MIPSEHKYDKARDLLDNGHVRFTDKTPDYYYFEVKDLLVKIPRTEEGTYNCTCQSGSIWNPGGHCSHIEACKMWLKEENIE